MKIVTVDIISRIKFISLCRTIARKHDCEYFLDGVELERVVFSGENVNRIKQDLINAITAFAIE